MPDPNGFVTRRELALAIALVAAMMAMAENPTGRVAVGLIGFASLAYFSLNSGAMSPTYKAYLKWRDDIEREHKSAEKKKQK